MAVVKQKTGGLHNNSKKPILTQPAQEEKFPTNKFTDETGLVEQKSVLGIFSSKSGKRTMPKVSEKKAYTFFNRFGKVALAEEKKYGIPASVILATAYVNSFAGTRNCAVHANNYFALSCDAVKGIRYDEHGRCMVKLNTAWEGFRTFSLYLEIQPWIKEAKNTAGVDAMIWVDIFEKMGLSDVEDYDAIAKSVIKDYALQSLLIP